MTASMRVRIVIHGAVQGVGFRPFIYRLATELSLTGWVCNSSEGVSIEAEGDKSSLERFLVRIGVEHPRLASIHSLEYTFIDPAYDDQFQIRGSTASPGGRTVVLPDIATCGDCLKELFDPNNRRYLYPFTNCTNCGPRFSIIQQLPYDRAHTTMRDFEMCERCRSEYEDPLDRRFHAQPNACADCGPQLEFWDSSGTPGDCKTPTARAVDALKDGCIVAVKGMGGFHLMVDAGNDKAVRRLRERKHREEKPLALMAPSMDWVRRLGVTGPLEARAVASPEAPIVLLRRQEQAQISSAVAPGNPYLGVMLPYTPLHHILMATIKKPLVATSGNHLSEPIVIDELDAVRRLNGIADYFLVHNRPICRHVDDSIVRIILGREQVLRRARGYAPLPVLTNSRMTHTLAVGAQLKNTVALGLGGQIFVSQHIGDLETQEANTAFRKVIVDLKSLFDASPNIIVADLHPDYASTSYAEELGHSKRIRVEYVQHHAAHVMACMADNEISAPALGVAWDGSGYGTDGSIWGGEFLIAHTTGIKRYAHFRTFPLPGGDAAATNPQQTALGVLYEALGPAAFDGSESPLLRQMLTKRFRCPHTSSVGRLFDAVAYLTGLAESISFEGQAAMKLEFCVASEVEDNYDYAIREDTSLVIDWEPMLRNVIADVRSRLPVGLIAAKFHNTLVKIIVDVAHRAGQSRVALTGGCFQNRYLTERAVSKLRESGFSAYWHQRVPPNDGGIALGQVSYLNTVSTLDTGEKVCASRFQAS